jgi:hypothetical protein
MDHGLAESDFKILTNPPVNGSFLFNFREDDPQQAEGL